MKRTLRLLSALLALCLLLTACGADQTPAAEDASRTVTDSCGRTVTLPDQVERIVPLGNAPRLVTYLGLADKVVAVPQCEHTDTPLMAYAYVNRDLWQDLPNVGNDSLGAGEWYAEEILATGADVVICTYDADTADNIQSQTGIPTVAVASPALFSEEYNDVLRLVGQVCGAEERAESLIACIQDSLADLEARTANIPDAEKPLVLGAGATFKGNHSIDGVYANYPVFQVLSARDAALGISDTVGGLLVDREQILAWDPDILFFDASSVELVQADYAADPAFFQQLKAVQTGQLYQWPNSTWHSSNVEIPLVSAYWVGQLLYPDAFADVDLEETAAEIFGLFLGQADYLDTLRDSGYGYQAVELGA